MAATSAAAPRNQRHLVTLKKRKDFVAATGSARRWVTPAFVLQLLPQPPQTDTNTITPAGTPVRKDAAALFVGFTASRKVGSAVTRNKARRRLRELARAVMLPHAQPKHAYVLVARPAASERNYTQMRSELEQALKRLGAWME